jgi:hypothetical protein
MPPASAETFYTQPWTSLVACFKVAGDPEQTSTARWFNPMLMGQNRAGQTVDHSAKFSGAFLELIL